MTRAGIFLCSSIALAAFSGCSDGPKQAQDPSDGQCNTVINDGPILTPSFVATRAPARGGGPISDGRWVETALTVYIGPGGEPVTAPEWVRSVIAIAGRTMQIVAAARSEKADGSERRFSSHILSAEGTTLGLRDTCPTTSDGFIEFTATATELRLYLPIEADVTLEHTYTKE